MNIGKQKFNKVAVVGLGYVGLPMASLFAIKGLNVAAFDLDADVVRQINCGQSHIRDKVVEDYVKRAHKSKGTSLQALALTIWRVAMRSSFPVCRPR